LSYISECFVVKRTLCATDDQCSSVGRTQSSDAGVGDESAVVSQVASDACRYHIFGFDPICDLPSPTAHASVAGRWQAFDGRALAMCPCLPGPGTAAGLASIRRRTRRVIEACRQPSWCVAAGRRPVYENVAAGFFEDKWLSVFVIIRATNECLSVVC